MLELRRYQSDAVEAAWGHLGETPGGTLIAHPTGTGKSIVIAELVRQALTRWPGYPGRCIVLAGSRELVSQNELEFKDLAPGIPCGVYAAGLNRREIEPDVLFGQIQSVHRLDPATWGKRSLILIDEAHQISLESQTMYGRFIAGIMQANPGCRCIGLSATPWRLDSGSIVGPADEGHIFQSLAHEYSLKDAIRDGYLAPLTMAPVPANLHADLSSVSIRGGEFVAGQAELAMTANDLVQRTIDDLLVRAKDAKCGVIFASGVRHCTEVMEALHARGEKATLITGETHTEIRDWAIEDLKRGACRWLVNVQCLTTGFNCRPVDAIVLLRPTASSGLLLQMIGRGTRLSPETGKAACTVYDYARNISRHGPIDMIQARDRRPGQRDGSAQDAPMKTCGNCGELVHARHQFCPHCSLLFPLNPQHEDTPDSTSQLFSGPQSGIYNVSRVGYSRHMKRDDGSGKPRYATLRVDYFQNDGSYLSTITPVMTEFVCLNHPESNFARGKAEQWWRQRSDSKIPGSVEEALSAIGELAVPSKITVYRKDQKSFPEIRRIQFGPPPEEVTDNADLPF